MTYKNSLIAVLIGFTFFACDSKNMVDNKDANTSTTTEKVNQLSIENSEVAEAIPTTTVSFDKTKHDFGTINEGDIVTTSYWIENTGDQPLVINDAKVSCGCTLPKIEKNVPIAPGEKSEIKVQFNSTNKPNKQNKDVKLYGNFSPNPKIITFTANVTPKVKSTGDEAGHEGHNH